MSQPIVLPTGPDDLQLIQWIGFCREYGSVLDAQNEAIELMPEGMMKQFARADHQLERLFSLAAYFHGVTVAEAEKAFSIPNVNQMYQEHFSKLFAVELEGELPTRFEWNGNVWVMPDEVLDPNASITFGEFIDSKIVMQSVSEQKLNKWELMLQIACIYLRKDGEPYTPALVADSSERLKLMEQLPMRYVLILGEWFERFNNFLHTSFPVFADSKIKTGKAMSVHFKSWGWVNFLVSIAKTKIFDIPDSGMNSIDCTRAARCYDVLIYASQEKCYNEAAYFDMEAANKR